jgi:hypothetical protein
MPNDDSASKRQLIEGQQNASRAGTLSAAGHSGGIAMRHVSAQNPDSPKHRPPIEIHEMEGLTIVSAKLIIDEEGRDALVLNGDDGTSVVVAVRQEEGTDAFLEVSGENLLNLANPFNDA